MLETLGMSVLLLPLGMAVGWHLARRSTQGPGAAHLNPEYLSGLTHLVNQDPEQAIAQFSRLVEADRETVETHLMLGSLFRRKGEVDRALAIHEALLQRELPPASRDQARYELAQDYLKAGVLDRAERLLQDLVADGRFAAPALQLLVSLHEQAGDWPHAAETARKLQSLEGKSRGRMIAHYLCEEAEQQRTAGDLREALRLAGEALREDERCVRASLLKGALLEAQGQHRDAIAAYRRILEQDLRFLSEVLPSLERCHQALGDAAGLWQELDDAERHSRSLAPTLARLRLLRAAGTDPTAAVATRLASVPGWRGLAGLLELLPAPTQPELAQALADARTGLEKWQKQQPGYRCDQCGLSARLLFWQCPSCKGWGTIAPLDDI